MWKGTLNLYLKQWLVVIVCIGSDIEGIRNLISNGENGLLSYNDPESLRCSILKVVHDDLLCNKLGINARVPNRGNKCSASLC
jgi:glycosyltransferase involved in cell wall biosynthesis